MERMRRRRTELPRPESVPDVADPDISPVRRPRLARFLAASAVCLLAAAGTARADSCVDHILKAEKEHGIPRGLMLAVALVESGQDGLPSPFAVNVKGRAVYARSETEAASYLRDGRGQVRGAVTAGCMQISLAHHSAAFRPVEKIVDPQHNVGYAARYLVRLRNETGSWAKAVARYNGSAGKTARTYQCKVQRQLAALGVTEVALVDAANCGKRQEASIAPRTRRAFQQAALDPLS